jgi:hypothetical protein
MSDFLGRQWRQKPLHERVLPWKVYAVLAAVGAACGMYLLSGQSTLSNTRFLGAVFLLALGLTYLAVVSQRVR